MSKVCDICGKSKMPGHKVSHSNKKFNRQYEANLQTTVLTVNGKEKRVKVCTKCIKTLNKKA